MAKNKNLDIFFIIKKKIQAKRKHKVLYKVIIKSNKGFVTKKLKKHHAKTVKHELYLNYIKIKKGLYVNVEKINFENQESILLKEARKNGEKVINLLNDLPMKLSESLILTLNELPSKHKKCSVHDTTQNRSEHGLIRRSLNKTSSDKSSE
jgi:hypothetical protein